MGAKSAIIDLLKTPRSADEIELLLGRLAEHVCVRLGPDQRLGEAFDQWHADRQTEFERNCITDLLHVAKEYLNENPYHNPVQTLTLHAIRNLCDMFLNTDPSADYEHALDEVPLGSPLPDGLNDTLDDIKDLYCRAVIMERTGKPA